MYEAFLKEYNLNEETMEKIMKECSKHCRSLKNFLMFSSWHSIPAYRLRTILDIYNEASGISAPINKSNIVLTGLVYYPELDEYETVVHTNYRSGLQNVIISDTNSLAAMKDFGGVWYYGEILYVKAEYYLNDRMIESLSWYREE